MLSRSISSLLILNTGMPHLAGAAADSAPFQSPTLLLLGLCRRDGGAFSATVLPSADSAGYLKLPVRSLI
jgi:hypothetical protein